MTTRRPYKIAGTRCERCGSEGPFLLDPEEEFTIDEAGNIRFPEGVWGIDIDCDCPACGFAARLGDFYEWVEVPFEACSMGEEKEPVEVGRTEPARIPAKGTLPPVVEKAIEEILWYLWQKEMDNFIADEPPPDEEHAFRLLVALDQWFHGHERSAEEFVREYEAENEMAVERLRSTQDE